MSANADTPTFVGNNVVDTFVSGVTCRFHRIASERARGRGSITGANVDRICRVPKVVGARVLSRLRKPGVCTWGDGQTKPGSWERLWDSLEGDSRVTISQAKERGNGASERMTSKPYVSVGIKFRHVGVQLASGSVIAMLFSQCLDHARVVAGEGIGSTVADLMPGPLTLLGAATTEEEIVILLVVGGCSLTVEDGHRSALETDDDSRVCFVGEDVAAKAISLPSKIGAAVIGIPNFIPIRILFMFHVGIGCHSGQGQDCLLVGDIGRRDIIKGPGRRIENRGVPLHTRHCHDRVHDGGPTVNHSLYRRRSTLCSKLGELLFIVAILSSQKHA